MRRIENSREIEAYYKKLEMHRFSSGDIKNYIELFKFEKNENICREGEKIENFMFFIDGKAKVFKTLQNGKTLLLSFYKPLQVIGDMEIVKNQPATSTIQALCDCYCIVISMEKARSELIEDSKFLKFICESLAEKLSVISLNSSINLLYPLENRLASYINELSVFVDKDTKKEYIEFDDNLINIAELLGSSYRHLLRTLKNLCQKEIIERDKKGYTVINEKLLEELAGDLYHDTKF